MIQEIKDKYGLSSPEVFSAMRKVPREKFAPKKYFKGAYEDGPISIGFGQTMSQPYTVAFMTHLLGLKGNERVLEIGTGCGYQAAILSKLAKEVYSIEIIEKLAESAKKRLKKLKVRNVLVKHASGEYGWKEKAPFDAILITAGIENGVPEALFKQLKDGGNLVAPIGIGHSKIMTRYKKQKDKLKRQEFGEFHFVPFVIKKN